MINPGIVKFLEKLSSGFFSYREICRCVDQITYKNGKKSSSTEANQILLSRNRPKQSPSFLVKSFSWNQTAMRWNWISRPHNFFWILTNYVDSMQIHCFDDP